jgi:hypothetical protein
LLLLTLYILQLSYHECFLQTPPKPQIYHACNIPYVISFFILAEWLCQIFFRKSWSDCHKGIHRINQLSCWAFFCHHFNWYFFLQDYLPNNQDILHARKATKGVTEFVMNINSIPFRFVDVGGQRSQRQKWLQCFDSVTAILFLVSSSEYDQVLMEDR